MDPKLITPLLIAAVVMWAVYRRVRRNFGRQPVTVGRMWFRVVVLGIAGLAMLVFARDLTLAGALLGGTVFGAGLGYFGLQHTKFEVTPEGKFYTPHTYVGLFVTVLFLGRLVFRLLTVIPQMHAAHQVNENPFDAYQRSPLTLAIFGVLIGYYVTLYIGVLQRSRHLKLPPVESST